MMLRQKQTDPGGGGGGRRPVAPASLLYGLWIGIAVSNLAAGAMMAGAGAALGKAIAAPMPRKPR